jgi:FkbM family methyltransferase
MIYMKPQEIVKAFGSFKGVLHVGAHLCEERNDYMLAGINKRVWVEANPSLITYLDQTIGGPDDIIINVAVSEFDDESVRFNVANNGQSSSILPLKLHQHIYRDIVYRGFYDVKTKSLKTILDTIENSQDLDLINLDLQGVELRALRGLGERLRQFRAVYTEVNTLELYENCDMMSDMDVYLSEYGFEKVGYKLWGNDGWGDALYVRPQ